MMKAVVLLMLTALVVGCQSIGARNDQEERVTTLRCWYFRDQHPLTEENIEYIREGSENGNLSCKLILGNMYERGLGMPKDVAKAKAIYQSIADVHEAAYSQLGRMAEEGVGEPVDYVKARHLYERATSEQGNKLGAVQLAKLMEDGKGGPQDLNGALALYLSSMELYEDAAWKGIQRLRARGPALSAEQEKRYNEIWGHGVRSVLTDKIQDTQRQLSKEIKPGPTIKPGKIQLEFSLGSDMPEVSLLESSGDPAIDQAMLKAVSAYRISDEPILPKSQKTWTVVSDFSLDLK